MKINLETIETLFCLEVHICRLAWPVATKILLALLFVELGKAQTLICMPMKLFVAVRCKNTFIVLAGLVSLVSQLTC
jgi:hypothetical protein